MSSQQLKATTTRDRRAERRQNILHAAARLFAEVGFASCEMERVSSELGVAKGTLYLYFKTKQDLFFACVDGAMQELQEALRAVSVKHEDPFERIAEAIHAYLAFFDRNPHYVELLIQERAIFRDRKKPTYFEYRDANRGPWRELYESLVAQGRIRSDVPVTQILDTIGSLLYGTMFTNHFVGRSVSLRKQYKAILEIVFRGILITPAAIAEACRKR